MTEHHLHSDQTPVQLSDPSLPPGIGSRDQLLEDLGRALVVASGPKLMVIFELVGLRQLTNALGPASSARLLARLGARLVEAVGASGSCYSLRGAELGAVLVDDAAFEGSVILAALAASLAENVGGYEVTSAFGSVLLPDEATDVGAALELADQRLNVQKRAGTRDLDARDLEARFEEAPV
jgi:predicted signal transduction protein with EAL and GGDEF domain